MPTRTSPSAGRSPARRSWAGVAPSDRQAERRSLLLDAAFELLGTEGSGATTVRAICARARLNPRYFYESFGSLDELIVAVYDRVVEELGAEVVAALEAAGDDATGQMAAVVRTTVEFVDGDRRRARVLYVEALDNAALNRRRIETGHAVVAFVEAAAAERHDRLPAGDHIGRVGAAVLVGGFGELLVAWLDGRIDMSREQLIEDATALFLALGDAAAGIAARRTRRR